MTNNRYNTVIIGAGLTGLATALLLKQKGFSVLVVEKSGHIGGAIQTRNKNGYIYESGPTTASLSNVETVRLFDMLKGKCELETARKEAKRRLILKHGKLHALPAGIVGGIFTPLFRWTDKFRILAEPFRKAGSNPNESVAGLARRRLGKSFLDYAVQPFIGGIYAGDPEKLITRFALPKMYQVEQEYGSCIKGAFKKCMIPKTGLEKQVTKKVFSVKGGFGNLINALAECVGHENILLNQDCKVLPGDTSGWTVRLSSGNIHAANVVCTAGGHAVGRIFDFMPSSTRTSIEAMNYAKIVQVAVGVTPCKGMDINALGLLVPSVEKRDVLGVLCPSSCFEGRASDGKALLSVFLGGVNNPGIIEKSDSHIKKLVLKELGDIYGLPEANVEWMEIFRHTHAIPQYEIICEKLLKDISEFERTHCGVILAGNMRDGIGIPNRIKQAFDISNGISASAI